MSATGFQRRRRELAAQQAHAGGNAGNTELLSGNGQDGSGHDGENGVKAVKINLGKLNKEKLLAFCHEKGLYDESLDALTKAKIVEAVIEKAKAKIVEAELKTAEEIAAVSAEDELFALFDSIPKQE
jgi:hypothetical protein